MKEIYYNILQTFKKMNKEIKLILTGDYNQLKPVLDKSETFNYKDSNILNYLCDNNELRLLKCRRSDDKLFNLIQFDNINNLIKEDFLNTCNKSDINICFTNKKRISINDMIMKEKYEHHTKKL
jgi:hypothetical protein